MSLANKFLRSKTRAISSPYQFSSCVISVEHVRLLSFKIQDEAQVKSVLEELEPKPDARSGWQQFFLGDRDKVMRRGQGSTRFMQHWRSETTDVAYSFDNWARLQSPWRLLKLFSFRGLSNADTFRRLLFPDLCVVACSASFVSSYNYSISSQASQTAIQGVASKLGLLVLPIEPFQLTALALGLLVTFRTQSSYARFEKARLLWASGTANSQELCSRIIARIPTPRSASETHPDILIAKICGAKLAQTFPLALKHHLIEYCCNATDGDDLKRTDKQRKSMRMAAFESELSSIWNFNDPVEYAVCSRLLQPSVENLPLQVCHELTQLNATQYSQPHVGGLGHPNSEGLDAKIMTLQQVRSECESLLDTPIYTPYTKFTGRVAYIFLNCLPLGMYPLVGPVGTPFVCVAIAYVFLGIDDIGLRVEQPFDNLPLWQYVEKHNLYCQQLLANAEISNR